MFSSCCHFFLFCPHLLLAVMFFHFTRLVHLHTGTVAPNQAVLVMMILNCWMKVANLFELLVVVNLENAHELENNFSSDQERRFRWFGIEAYPKGGLVGTILRIRPRFKYRWSLCLSGPAFEPARALPPWRSWSQHFGLEQKYKLCIWAYLFIFFEWSAEVRAQMMG